MDIPKHLNRHSPRFIEQFRVYIRTRHLAYQTEKTYCQWVGRFIRYHGYCQASQMQPIHIDPFLTHLAVERNVAIATQKTALNALVFLFREFLGQDIGKLSFNRAKRPRKLPTVLSQQESAAIIVHLKGLHKIIVQLMYGSGLRIMEAVRLRVKDIDFGSGGIWIQEAKGGKARRSLLPETLKDRLHAQIDWVSRQHQDDIQAGYGSVYLPDALAKKWPNAPFELAWQYLFPASHYSQDPRSGISRRHHMGAQQVPCSERGHT